MVVFPSVLSVCLPELDCCPCSYSTHTERVSEEIELKENVKPFLGSQVSVYSLIMMPESPAPHLIQAV